MIWRLRFVPAGVFFHDWHGFLGGLLIQELKGQGNDLRVILCLAVVLIFIGLEPSFDVNETALLEIFLADLAEPAPRFDVDPFGAFMRFALALPFFGNGDAERGYFLAVGRELAFGIPAKPANQLNAI